MTAINGAFKVDARDKKILEAMISNLMSFLGDAHRKSKNTDCPETTVTIKLSDKFEYDKTTIDYATNRILTAKYRGLIDGDIAAELIELIEDPKYAIGVTEDDEYAEDEEDEDYDDEEE
jgi:hypothetical protein